MVSRLKIAIGSTVLLTLLIAAAGLWVYHSHISPIAALAEGRSIGEVLDQIKYMRYTMEHEGKIYEVEVYNNPKERSGLVRALVDGRTLEYTYNYTNTVVIVYVNSTALSPVRYLGAFATNIYYVAEESVKMEPFPGIAPVYALNFLGNATNINWGSFVSARGERTPQNVRILFANIKTGEGEVRGSEILIEGYQLGSLTEGLKWYAISARALVAKVGPLAVAWDLEFSTTAPGTSFSLRVKLEKIELAG